MCHVHPTSCIRWLINLPIRPNWRQRIQPATPSSPDSQPPAVRGLGTAATQARGARAAAAAALGARTRRRWFSVTGVQGAHKRRRWWSVAQGRSRGGEWWPAKAAWRQQWPASGGTRREWARLRKVIDEDRTDWIAYTNLKHRKSGRWVRKKGTSQRYIGIPISL